MVARVLLGVFLKSSPANSFMISSSYILSIMWTL